MRDGKSLQNSTGKTLSLKNSTKICAKYAKYAQNRPKMSKNAKKRYKKAKNTWKKHKKIAQMRKICKRGAFAACTIFHLCMEYPLIFQLDVLYAELFKTFYFIKLL